MACKVICTRYQARLESGSGGGGGGGIYANGQKISQICEIFIKSDGL
jgi:hypothetical protein